MRSKYFTWATVALLVSAPVCAEDKADSAVRFVVAPAATDVKLTIDRRNFEYEVLIEAPKEIKGTRVQVTDFVGPSRIVPTCVVIKDASEVPCSSEFDLKAGDSRTVRLTAVMDPIGTFNAVLSVVGASMRRNVALSVTRSATPMPVELAASVPAMATRGRTLKVDIPLQERFGLPAQLGQPALTFTRRDPGKTGSEGAVLNTSFTLAGAELGQPWKVEARASPVLTANISNIADAGEYTGRLRVTSSSSGQSLDIPITFTKSDSWFLAALLIAIGTLGSFFLKTYLKTVRPRIAQQRTAGLLALDIEKLRNDLIANFDPLQPAETAAVAAISERLSTIDRPLDEVSFEDALAILNEVDAKLSMVRRWVNARRRAVVIAGLPAEVHATLHRIGMLLQQPKAIDVSTVENDLKGAEDKIGAALIEQITKRMDSLGKAIESSSYLQDATKQTLLVRLEAVASVLGDSASKSLLDAIEGELLFGQIAGLEREIGEVVDPPVGFAKASWSALAQEVRSKLALAKSATSVAERGLRFNEALRHYLDAVREALVSRLNINQDKIQNSAKLTDEQRRAALAEIATMQDNLKEAKSLLASGDLTKAAALLSTHGGMVAQMEKANPGLLGAGGGADALAAPAPTGLELEVGGSVLFSGLGLRGQRYSSRTPADWKTLIGKLDVVVLVVALVASVALGMKLLWVDNATWGTTNDYMVALLWGLGLHQLSNATFEGITGVFDKYRK